MIRQGIRKGKVTAASGGAGRFVSVSVYRAGTEYRPAVSRFNQRTKTMGQVNEAGAIREYHAHVYYDNISRNRAADLRVRIGARFTDQAHPLRDAPIGPHLSAQYQIVFNSDQFPWLVPFLMMNRMELTVLVHPQSGRPRDDHTLNALWMGEVLPVNVEFMRKTEERG
jgi:aromatic ring-cleaving dioxygenase